MICTGNALALCAAIVFALLDLRHRQILENPMIVTELQVVQHRHQGQVITGQAYSRFTRDHVFYSAMNTFAVKPELEKFGCSSIGS
jgi:hypothetical protein